MNRPRLASTGLTLALALWLAATAGRRPLMLPDEGRYVGVALEMLRSGSWAVPTLDGLPYFHKPPLFYWITAAAMGVFGPHAWAARAAPLLGAMAMTLAVAWFARRWISAAAARWSPWIVATMPFAYLGAQFANLDMLVAGCITVAVLTLADAVLRAPDDPAAARSALAGWVAMALGVLAKGLIGIVLPLAVLLVWLAARPDRAAAWRAALGRLISGSGIAAFAVLAVPWFALVEARHPGFLNYFFVHHHLARFASGGFNNEQPWWFYLPVIALLGLPWTVLLWPPARAQRTSDQRVLQCLLVCWAAVVVVFFSLPRSKLIGYVLPALPPLALLIADHAERRFGAAPRRARRAFAATAVAVCLAGVLAVALHRNARPDHAALAAALDAEAGRDEPVYALELQPYDLGLHSRRAREVRLVADWNDPAIGARDDWHRELADAARFAPSRAAAVLLTPAQARAQWCVAEASWVIAPLDAAARAGVLPVSDAPLTRTSRAGLWRLERARLEQAGVCPRTPSGGWPATSAVQ